MAYVPINIQAFVSAYSGALSGMAVSGWVTDNVAVDYQTVTEIVGAFAQAFDLAWNDAADLNNLQIRAITTVAQQEFTGRGPSQTQPEFSDSATWAVPAAALVALIQEADAYFTGQAIDPGTPGGNSGVISAESYGWAAGDGPGTSAGGPGYTAITLPGAGTASITTDGTVLDASSSTQPQYKLLSGATRIVLCRAIVTLQGDGVADYNVALAIDHFTASGGGSHDTIGQTAVINGSQFGRVLLSATDFVVVVTERILVMEINDTVEPCLFVLGGGGSDHGLQLANMQFTVQILAEL